MIYMFKLCIVSCPIFFHFFTLIGVAELYFLTFCTFTFCSTHPKRLWHSSGQKCNVVLIDCILNCILNFKCEMKLHISFLLRIPLSNPQSSQSGEILCACVEMCLTSVNLSSFLGKAYLSRIIRKKSKTRLIVRLLYIEIFVGSLFCAFLGEWINRLLNFYAHTEPLVCKAKNSSFIPWSSKVFQKSRIVVDLWESE